MACANKVGDFSQKMAGNNESLYPAVDVGDECEVLKDIGEPLDECMRLSPECGPVGRPLFIANPAAHPASRPDCFTIGPKGYGTPYQHPLYTTSNGTYGRVHMPPELNPDKFPKNNRFTARQGLGGPYKDVHFTTQVDPQQ